MTIVKWRSQVHQDTEAWVAYMMYDLQCGFKADDGIPPESRGSIMSS